MLFPDIEFDPLFGQRDRRLITFIVHSIIREYHKKLAPFTGFLGHPIKKFTIQPSIPEGCTYLGLTTFRDDKIDIVSWPLNISGVLLQSQTALISHEIAHHIIQEWFGDYGIGNRMGVNLVHYAANTGTYQYTKRYWSPRFFFKYGLFDMKIHMFDIARLIAESWIINHDIEVDSAPKGLHQYV